MNTLLDEKTRIVLNSHFGRNHDESLLWKASKKAQLNTVNHANPYKDSTGNKIYPEKVNVLILASDVLIKYLFQQGRCYYSGEIIDLSDTIYRPYSAHGMSPNRRVNGKTSDFTVSNTVLVTQEVMRDKHWQSEEEYQLGTNLSTLRKENLQRKAAVTEFNFELTKVIRILNSLDHLTLVSQLISELKTKYLKD